MIEYVNVTKTISVGSDKVWAAISAIGGLDQWFPIIAECCVNGDGVGAVRIMKLADGSEINDRIEEINDAEKRFRYTRTACPFPVSRYLGTVELRDDNGGTAVSWTIEMDVAAQDRDDMVALITGALSDGIDGLGRYLMADSL